MEKVITSDPTLSEAFSYLQTVMPLNSFFGRSGKGPSMFITDDRAAKSILYGLQ